jgi:DNA-binding CsgD family transcriptional regulator
MPVVNSSLPKIQYIKWIFLLCLFFPLSILAQTYSTEQLLAAWRTEGITQTIISEKAYADLTQTFHQNTFKKRLQELEVYIAKNPDRRLSARIILFKMQGDPKIVSLNELWQCILSASELKDDQLLSEMYAKYAELKAPEEEKLYYLLKALQIQERIGVSNFKHIYYRYLTVGGLLYRINDFKQSLHYGLKGLQSFDKKTNYALDYVYLVDLIGSSYKHLGQLDSAQVQYENLSRLLKDYELNPDNYSPKKIEKSVLNIWKGIIDGGKGRVLVLKGNYAAAIPLLKSNLDSAIKYQDFGNAASVLNVLGDVNYKNQSFSAALKLFQVAHNYGFQANEYYHLKAKLETAEGLTKTFSALKVTDSAFLYLKEFDLLKDSVQNVTNAYHFSATNTELKFELMQKDFLMAQQEVDSYKLLRNVSILGVLVLAIVASLLYNAKLLKHKAQQEKLSKEKELAQKENDYAKSQLKAFINNIFEKNKLIEELRARYEGQTNTNQILTEEIRILTDDDWNEFRNTFVQVYPSFLAEAKRLIPDVSATELRFLALSKLNMPTKEMAIAQGITQHAVRKQRHRLRKRLEAISPGFTLELLLEKN